jgi:[ribosomal protein S5]-alanine N-acetyltransferase
MILKSHNFILRPAKKSDLQSWFRNYQDKDTARNFMSIPKNLKEAEKELFEKNKDSEGFVIDVNGEAVGGIGVHDIVKGHKATMSFWIAKKCRGKGVMTKAVNLVTKYFFRKYKLKRIDGNVRTFNKASARVMEKAGYKLEGILRKNKLKNGKFMNDMVFAKVK